MNGTVSNDCITISGGNTITLSQDASGPQQNGSVTVYNGLYRMIGALYTVGSGDVVAFAQDGDTFYLATPVVDIRTGASSLCASSITSSAVSCALAVPCGRTLATCASPGFKVEAFGRVVGGTSGEILLSSLDQTNSLPPGLFSAGPPGFSTNNSATATGFPFRLYTNGNGQVRVQGSVGSSNTVYEDTDGWVLHR